MLFRKKEKQYKTSKQNQEVIRWLLANYTKRELETGNMVKMIMPYCYETGIRPRPDDLADCFIIAAKEG
jgi:hypothetical protein